MDAASDDSLSNDDDSTKKRRDILTRRPSYRKILNDLGGGEIAGNISASDLFICFFKNCWNAIIVFYSLCRRHFSFKIIMCQQYGNLSCDTVINRPHM